MTRRFIARRNPHAASHPGLRDVVDRAETIHSAGVGLTRHQVRGPRGLSSGQRTNRAVPAVW